MWDPEHVRQPQERLEARRRSFLPALNGASVDVHPPRELLVRPAASQTSRTYPLPYRLWGEPHEEGKSATAGENVLPTTHETGMS